LIVVFGFGTISEDLRSWMWMFSVGKKITERVISSQRARLPIGGGLGFVLSSDTSYPQHREKR